MAIVASPSSDACDHTRTRKAQLQPLNQRVCRYVARSAQGQGLGRQLFALALDWMLADSDGGGGSMWIECELWLFAVLFAASLCRLQSLERQRVGSQYVCSAYQSYSSHIALYATCHNCCDCMYAAQGFARAGGCQFAVGAWRDDEGTLRKGYRPLWLL